MKDLLIRLFSSRKFILVLLATIVITVLTALGKIPVAQMGTEITVLIGILVAALGLEDQGKSAEKLRSGSRDLRG